ncbi:hypothetical protein KSP40_PGU018980 [Platanthera guangdongensis]|uniref:Uncharacterized protein n=1 Tax=Platanthera guangdongensis TaxID=2320717 RepID=A0ABR2ME84_9ASPA
MAVSIYMPSTWAGTLQCLCIFSMKTRHSEPEHSSIGFLGGDNPVWIPSLSLPQASIAATAAYGMPEPSGKADPSATAGGVDSPAVDQEQALFEVDEEEVEVMEEDEEVEDGSEGEEKEMDEIVCGSIVDINEIQAPPGRRFGGFGL